MPTSPVRGKAVAKSGTTVAGDVMNQRSLVMVRALAGYLTAIHNHFQARSGGDPDLAMDVEWKLAPGRVVEIKQARPLVRR